MIPAIVLTAGLATRLRPLSLLRAKAALPVAGEPLVRRILRRLADAGVSDAVLNLHHLPDTITAVVGDGSDLGVTVRYSWESIVLGSAGGPRRALPLLAASDGARGTAALIVNGDTLTDVDVRALARAHEACGSLVTLAVVPNDRPDKYGGVSVDSAGNVTGFVKRGSDRPSFHFVGVQAVDAQAFASVPENVPFESVGALYPALIRERPGAVRAFPCTAECLDIGTPADYLATSLELEKREGRSPDGQPVTVHPSAWVVRSVLWDDVVVEADVRLSDCVVADRTRVPAGTTWDRVTLRPPHGPLAGGEWLEHGLAVGRL